SITGALFLSLAHAITGSITGALFLSLIEEASHPDYIIGAPPRVGANSFQHETASQPDYIIGAPPRVSVNSFQHETVMAHHALLGEFMGTFLLCLVVLETAVNPQFMGSFLLCLVVLETAVNPQAVTQEGGKTVKGNKMNLAPIPIGFAVFIAHGDKV
ncbi:hypothetical protein T484DRAFT_1761541, partial [Baffinella frigidus]